MTKLIGKLNEQGYTNFRTSLHRIRLISVVAAVAALLSLYPLHEYLVRANFSPLQSEYYGQYWWSSFLSHFSNTRSTYTYVAASIIDRETGRDREIPVTDSDVIPVRDAQGRSSSKRVGRAFNSEKILTRRSSSQILSGLSKSSPTNRQTSGCGTRSMRGKRSPFFAVRRGFGR
jgi:hypothetical protein